MWTSTGQLGDVQSGQQTGYLFPMGPFFAVGHAFGIPDWIVQRLWLGTLLALAAWGVVRLLDALLGRPRGVAHLVAGAVILLNPFVVTYANRTTVTLLAYAALPWLLLVVHRGLRESHRWRWPAAFGLLVAASGGGINGAVTAWMLLGPALLLCYEIAFTRIGWRQARGFVWRTLLTTVLTSLWWIVPAYVQSSYGIDFLHFTEQPGTIWGTTSATETLRLMSFWLSYVGIGFNGRAIPYFDDQHTLLFSLPVVIATLLVPAARAGRLRVDAQMALRTVLPGPGADRRTGDAGGVPRRDAASPRPDVRLQPLRIGSVPARLLQGRAAAGRVAGVPGGGRRGPGVVAAGRDLAPRDRARGRRRRAGAGRVAVGHRQGPGPSGLLQGDPGRVASGGARCRSGPAAQLAGDRAPRGPVLVLHLGRHRRPDPAGAVQAVGGRTHRGPVRRPAGDGSAVDGRRARAPAQARAGPARAAAVADGRAPGDHRHRRRPRQKRRSAAGRCGLRARRPGARAAHAQLRAGVELCAQRGRSHAAAGAGAPLQPPTRAGHRPRGAVLPTRSSSTVRPTRSRGWPPLARFHQTGPCCTPATCPRRRFGGRSRAGAMW